MAPRRVRASRDIQPMRLDCSITFNSIGGLEDHIRCLREMVLFPLMYPEFFKRFNTRPPKGVLFHGPPGSGKTLLARALANECSLIRGKKVAFFMRKGADVMSKWYGESEKHIKMLFQQANKMRPSIIFFDEMDALAPSRSEGQGEVYTSVVATLLVEMDGLWDRGDVIVIGATNRPDCLDPALRRPGRFDRELYFPPPGVLARRDILNIHTQHWLPRPTESMLDYVAQITSGYLGSDLYALCSEAVLRALRRVYPQVYEGDNHSLSCIDTRIVEVKMQDLIAAKRALMPAGTRCVPMAAKHLPAQCMPLLQGQVDAAAAMIRQAFPPAEQSQGDVCSPSVFLISGDCAETYLAPAILAQLEHCHMQELSMATLHSAQTRSLERAIISVFSECRRVERSCVLFVPNVVAVWETLANSPGQALLLQLWRTRAAGDNILLLATCSVHHEDLPEELQELFPLYKNCIYRVREPTQTEVMNFMAPIIAELPTIQAIIDKPGSSTALSKISRGIDSEASSSAMTESNARKRKNTDTPQIDYKRAKYAIDTCIFISDDKYDANDDNKIEVKPDLGKVLKANVDNLCRLGLDTLTDLHAQLTKAVQACCSTRDFMRLPQELHSITVRYLKIARKS